jgi:carnitine 3-dehydrogenase
VLASYERSLFAARPAESPREDEPLRLVDAVVRPEWVDYNGHMHESRYLQLVGDAADALFRLLRVDLSAGSYYTVETHLSLLREMVADERVEVTVQLLGHDAKRLHAFHTVHRSSSGEVTATAEQMYVHVDAATGRAAAAPDELLARVARLVAAHAALPRPECAGRRIEL